ncbi:MAG: hypothetical protein HQ517_18450 [SAR324 cluster bacterium]|nr:hypothetical protein [SAR324 cluster bacterium]
MNDRSIDGQFEDLSSFRESIDRVMQIRQAIKQSGRELYCHKNALYANVTPTSTIQQIIGKLAIEQRRVLIPWLTNQGPFWEDARLHDENELFYWNEDVVTNSAIGEAAWCCLQDMKRHLVSLVPSDWEFSPVPVDWVISDDERKPIDVENFWDLSIINRALHDAPTPIGSWADLVSLNSTRWSKLRFSDDAFESLDGRPFVSGAAKRIVALLDTLHRYKTCFDEDGTRTPEGNEIYRDFFTGKKGDGGRGALFTDSSEPEKHKYRSKLTFRHPVDRNQTIFCPWHGKVQTPQLRIHFSTPITKNDPLYIVYVGEKLTKK